MSEVGDKALYHACEHYFETIKKLDAQLAERTRERDEAVDQRNEYRAVIEIYKNLDEINKNVVGRKDKRIAELKRVIGEAIERVEYNVSEDAVEVLVDMLRNALRDGGGCG